MERASSLVHDPFVMSYLGSRLLELLQRPVKFNSFQQLCHQLNVSKKLPIFQKSSPVFQNQRGIRKIRMSIPRELSYNKTLYAAFLRKLYPLEQHTVHKDLYAAYCALPSPQPLHIEPQHFEHLLCQFVDSGGFHRGINTNYLANIMTDMFQCGMKASLREVNNYLYLKNYNNNDALPLAERDYEYVLKVSEFHISTANIFLKFAIQTRNVEFISRILNDIAERNLKFDRMTYQMLISYSCDIGDTERSNALFENYLDSGHVLDISIVNTIIKSLVSNGELSKANEIVEVLFKNAKQLGSRQDNSNATHSRRQNVQELNFIDSLKLQKQDSLLFVPTPTFNSFSPLLYNYCSFRHFDALKIFKYLEEMNDLNIEIPNSMYIHIFKSFQEQDVKDLDYLKFTLNFLINEKNVKYNDELFESILESFLKHSGYRNKLVNGIENQWSQLKMNLIKGGSFKKGRSQVEEFSIDAINKLMVFY